MGSDGGRYLIVAAAFFVYGPLALLAIVLNGLAVGSKSSDARGILVFSSRAALIALWASGCVLAWVSRVEFRDWVHLFWATQIPLVGIFLGSGAFLYRVPRHDTVDPRELRRTSHGVWILLAMTAILAVAPIPLIMVLPEDHPSSRETGAPVEGLMGLAAWGLGGSMPEVLTPNVEHEIRRGVGSLPRDLTVPMGTTLIAAWLWIGLGVIALVSRLLPSARAGLVLYLLGPPLVAGLAWLTQSVLLAATQGVLDARFFGPIGAEHSGIWRCDPVVVRSYGPVLIAGALAGILLIATTWRRSPPTDA